MLRLEAIGVQLGAFRLKNISLHVEPGAYLVLLGPTGTGKTVLLETIAGLHRPTGGRTWIDGKDATRWPPEKRNLGVVYQDYALFPHLTVQENIAFGLRLKKEARGEIKKTVEEMAGFLEIGHLLNRRPGRLSGGEQQRVALARALVLKPYVLLLDEPLSALDRSTRGRLRRELKRIHRELGVTIFHITHDLPEAFFLADHLALMKDGGILQEGKPEMVLRRPRSRTVAELLGIENLLRGTKEGERYLSGLGALDIPEFPSREATGRESAVYFSVPGWCVEIFPGKGDNPYTWKGKMRLAAMNFMNGHVDLDLVYPSGEHLKTSLSRREFGNLPVSIAVGIVVPVGILKEGVYWFPR
ncbi:MAG: ATP-binding cassette domain-containing protein [Desulfatiglandaceae bacterium]